MEGGNGDRGDSGDGPRPDEAVVGWFLGRIPDDWFVDVPAFEVDRDEIVVIGDLAEPRLTAGVSAAARTEALRSRLQAFREETRGARVRIAKGAETLFGKKVSWGARCGDEEALFTHLATPAMTRLRMPERRVLDTLVDSGVARSRSDALSWCVRLVGQHEADWLQELRQAMESVHEVRNRGPQA